MTNGGKTINVFVHAWEYSFIFHGIPQAMMFDIFVGPIKRHGVNGERVTFGKKKMHKKQAKGNVNLGWVVSRLCGEEEEEEREEGH